MKGIIQEESGCIFRRMIRLLPTNIQLFLSLLFSEVQLYKGHCFDTKIEYRFTVVDMTFIDTLPEFLRLEVSDDHIDLLINTD